MATKVGVLTRREIESQPLVWTEILSEVRSRVETLRAFQQSTPVDAVLFTGCGSTYYLSLAAAAIFQALTGLPSRGLPASEIWGNQESAYSSRLRHLLVAVSRSGETSETIAAVKAFKQRGHGDVMTLTCHADSELAQLGAVNMVLSAAQEQSIVQTRAFTALQLGATMLAAIWAHRDDLLEQLGHLPAVAERMMSHCAERIVRLGRDARFDRVYFLGSGARYGLACEASLKMKEMSLSHSEPFHFLEFRHGPMSMANDATLLVGLVSEANSMRERAIMDSMLAQGTTPFTMGERDADVAFESGVDAAIRDVLYLPPLQLLAFERALSRGLDPDSPRNLSAVVRLPKSP